MSKLLLMHCNRISSLTLSFGKTIYPQCISSSTLKDNLKSDRRFSTREDQPQILPDIHYEELKGKLERKQVTLVDVRLPHELQKDGYIPGSINIPLQYLGVHIGLSNQDFEDLYRRSKLLKHEPIVTMCLIGMRSKTAQLALIGAGYSNVRNYCGSFKDWLENQGAVEFLPEN